MAEKKDNACKIVIFVRKKPYSKSKFLWILQIVSHIVPSFYNIRESYARVHLYNCLLYASPRIIVGNFNYCIVDKLKLWQIIIRCFFHSLFSLFL